MKINTQCWRGHDDEAAHIPRTELRGTVILDHEKLRYVCRRCRREHFVEGLLGPIEMVRRRTFNLRSNGTPEGTGRIQS